MLLLKNNNKNSKLMQKNGKL